MSPLLTEAEVQDITGPIANALARANDDFSDFARDYPASSPVRALVIAAMAASLHQIGVIERDSPCDRLVVHLLASALVERGYVVERKQ
jgi:hypothetical protein